MATEFIQLQRALYSDLSVQYGRLEELHSRRLWHQLTGALLAFVKDPLSSRGTNLVELYSHFIESFEAKIDQLALVQIVVAVSKQLYPSRPFVAEEVDRASVLVTSLLSRRTRLGPAASLVCEMASVTLRLQKASGALPSTELAALLDACKRDIAAGKKALDALPEDEDPAVPAAYYEAATAYHRVRGPAQDFFEAAMLFLSFAPADALSPEFRQAFAVDIALAALVGEGVYNFGEVCVHPILASLAGSPHAWLGALLRAYQVGSIDVFNAVVAEHRVAFEAQPALSANLAVLREKAALLAFMELAAAKPGTDRAIPIADISHATRLPADQVEWLVMRALSLGLARGAIDGVGGVVHVTYVRPRVLDDAQVVAVRERIEAWRSKAHAMLLQIEDSTVELFK